MKKIRRYAASLALGLSLTMVTPQAAQAIIRAPLAQSDDQMSRNVAFLAGGQCTGTLIDKEWVITAKHCIDYPHGDGIIKAGDTVDIGPDMKDFERRKVAETHVYPDPDPTNVLKYDIALIKLDKPSTITPAKVYDGSTPVPDGSRTRSYGFGTPISSRNSSGQYSQDYNTKIPFQTGKITNPSQVPNKDRLDFLEGPPSNVIYSRLDGTSRTVPGDSGGPLFLADGRLYGVLFGSVRNYEDMSRHSNSMYSALYPGMDWIEKVTGVDFTNKERNISIQKKIDSNPYKFRAPTKDDYAHAVEDETTGLKIQTYISMKNNDPDSVAGIEDPRTLPFPDPNGKRRDPSPFDSDVRAGDDKIPTGEDKPTSTSKDKPTTTSEDKPTTTSEDKPTTTSDNKPTTTSKDKTTTTSDSKPTTTSKDKPTTTSKDKTTTTSDSKPTTTSKDKPTTTSKDKTTTTSKDKTTTTSKDKTTTTSDSKPTTTGKDEPTTTSEDEPTTTSEDEPTTTGKDEPTTTGKDKPASTSEDEPVAEPTSSSSDGTASESTTTSEDSTSVTVPDVKTTSTSKSKPTVSNDVQEPKETTTSDSTSAQEPTSSIPDTKTPDKDEDEDDTPTSTVSEEEIKDKIKDVTGVDSENAKIDTQAKKERDKRIGEGQYSQLSKINDATGYGSPRAVISTANTPVSGPVVDTGGEVEKEGFFERIKNFLFG